MAQLTTQQYDRLERAITKGQRVSVYRRGTEYLVIPLGLRLENGRELIDARNPTTGDRMTLYIDEVDTIEVVQ